MPSVPGGAGTCRAIRVGPTPGPTRSSMPTYAEQGATWLKCCCSTTRWVKRAVSTPSPTTSVSAGHTVHAPDLFEGRTFSTIAEGVGYAGEVGFDEIIGRGERAAEALPGRACLWRVLAWCAAGAEARPDSARALEARCCSTPAFRPRSSGLMARWRAGAGPWDGCGPDLHGGGRRRRRARPGRFDRGCGAVPVPRRSALLRRREPPSYRADAAELLRQRVLDFLATR